MIENYQPQFEPLYDTAKTDPNEIWFTYEKEMIRLCKNLAYNKNFSYDDLLQEAYLLVIKACKIYDPYYNDNFKTLGAFIYGYTEQRLRAYIQCYYIKTKREQPSDFIIKDEHDGFANDILLEDTYDYIGNIDNKLFIEYIFSFLDEREKQIFIMYYFKNMKQHQIAEVLGCRQSRISLILKTCSKLIRQICNAKDSNSKKAMDKVNKLINHRNKLKQSKLKGTA
jgi:RNA polymerase sigma factor (sigma-70 family)